MMRTRHDRTSPAALRAAAPLTADAFAALADAHRPRVLRFATAFLGDRHLAEDVVQECSENSSSTATATRSRSSSAPTS